MSQERLDDDTAHGPRTASEKALDRYLLRRDRSGLTETLARRDGTWVEPEPPVVATIRIKPRGRGRALHRRNAGAGKEQKKDTSES